jgi:hypothetical protein
VRLIDHRADLNVVTERKVLVCAGNRIPVFRPIVSHLTDRTLTNATGGLVVAQLVKKFLIFNGTRRFFTVYTTARYLPLFRARLIQSTPSLPISVSFILILTSYLRVLFLSGFPATFIIIINIILLNTSICV